ncbi:protein of unknown function (plasmid) [Cupriavidus taiwanensis]|uniref:Uncharacterized protein n=1 Tax=Cupriavidus taiwanensis TaxID=164546 RepID=A0A375IVX7_9BURK|nr:protein of unknown function [Cupriavidus taiwanensis]
MGRGPAPMGSVTTRLRPSGIQFSLVFNGEHRFRARRSRAGINANQLRKWTQECRDSAQAEGPL